jgi:hypothetical protein
MKPSLFLYLSLAVCCFPTFAQAQSPADMISSYRVQHGEGRVVMDSTLTRIAHEQAGAMAAKDKLDHDVLGGFTSRVHSAGAGRAAENIAYGYDSFPKTLSQWIDSAGHRRNLLLHGASRVGVASVKSATTGRTYWAMEIAGVSRPPSGLAHFAKASCCPRSRLSVARRFSGHHLYQPSLCSSKRCTTAVQITNDRMWREADIRRNAKCRLSGQKPT